jgi:hypothetical protein
MARLEKPISRAARALLWGGLALVAACTPDPARRIPRPLDGATAADLAPAPDPSPAAPADASSNSAPASVTCSDAVPWKSGESYGGGKRVTHNAPPHIYECKPWPFSGWCPMAAYEPGKTDAPWTDAWIDLGVCP